MGLPPYQRPPLSKNYLAGSVDRESLYLKPSSVYENAGHQLKLGVRVEQINRSNKTILLSDQSTLTYDRLVLATGSRVRRLKVPGADLKGIHYLHDIADTDVLRDQLNPGKRLVIVGGGYIGLEVAAIAIKALVVTVLESSRTPIATCHRTRDLRVLLFKAPAALDVRLTTTATEFATDGLGHVTGVVGERNPTDIVLVSIRSSTETKLAESAGLACDDGILVDEHTRSNDPSILAIGDCTRHVWVESRNAVEQARTAAATLMGEDKPYHHVPWFWSINMTFACKQGGIVRTMMNASFARDIEGDAFAVFYNQEGRLIAARSLCRAFMVGISFTRVRTSVPRS